MAKATNHTDNIDALSILWQFGNICLNVKTPVYVSEDHRS